jgi:hypothetical protein
MVKILDHILWLLVALLLLFAVASAFTGCTVTKAKQTVSKDSTRTNITDSGSVKKNSNTEKTTADWERQIVLYNRDTTIEHYIYSGTKAAAPIDYSRLAAVINERGNYQQEKQIIIIDSSWKKAYDSLSVVIKKSKKEKTEKALSLWQIIGICAGVSLLFFLLSKIKLLVRPLLP